MTITLRYAALSDVGRVRKNNQDSGYASARLLVVADGMGGMAAGDLASAATVAAVRKVDEPLEADLLEVLAGAVQRANDRLGEYIEQDNALDGMGTTLTAVLNDGERLGLVHVGDSRAYRLRAGELSQLSRDHTFVQSLVDDGRITADEARVHPHRNLMIRAVDGRADLQPDLTMLDFEIGDRLLICSDGLCGYVEDDVIASLLGGETVDVAVVELVRAALDAGSTDNITCIVADVLDGELVAEEPMILGAAAEEPRPPTGGLSPSAALATESGADEVAPGGDPEELRYAPRPPRRFGRLRWLLALVVVVAVLGVGLRIAYDWSQRQYYVGAAGGNVAIYRGIDQSLPGIDLSSVYQTYDMKVDSLPAYLRDQVLGGYPSGSLDSARKTIAGLQNCDGSPAAAAANTGACAETTPATPVQTKGSTGTPTSTPSGARTTASPKSPNRASTGAPGKAPAKSRSGGTKQRQRQ